MDLLLFGHAIRIFHIVHLNLLPSEGESKLSLRVSFFIQSVAPALSPDSSQCLETCGYVGHLLSSDVDMSNPRFRLLYDGLGYFVVLTGTFLLEVVNLQPTSLS